MSSGFTKLVLLLFIPALQAAVPENSELAAEYYLARQDYAQAHQLYREITEKTFEPRAALRLGEISLLTEGRSSARERMNAFLTERWAYLSPEWRRQFSERTKAVLSTFLTDAGLSYYLQAAPRVSRGDCAGALPLYSQSLLQEGNHLTVLQAKASCERKQQSFEKYYETVAIWYQVNPFDVTVAEKLEEVAFYFGDYDRVIKTFADLHVGVASQRSRLFYAAALFEKGENNQALPVFYSLFDSHKQPLHPIVYYYLSKGVGKRSPFGSATELQNRFQQSASRLSKNQDAWDVFRIQEKLAPLKKG